MPTTPRPRHAILRAHVPQRVYDWINTRKCLHIDAWLYQMPDDSMYFVIIGSLAGRVTKPTFQYTFRVDPLGIYPYANLPDIERTGLKRTIGGPWARKHAPWAARHHGALRALIMERCEPYPRRSIILHYVWTDKRIDDPMAGLQNTYTASSRAARDAVVGVSVRDARRINAVDREASPWTAHERSLLRTLQKILS